MFQKYGIACRIVAGALLFAATTAGPVGAATLDEADQAASASPPEPPRAAALRLAFADGDVGLDGAREHYGATAYQGLWIAPDGDDAAALALLEAIDDAATHGLPPSRYAPAALRSALASARDGDLVASAQAEVAFTRAFLSYARDLTSGLLEPSAVDRELHVFPDRPEAARLLSDLRKAPAPAAYLASLAPAHPEYARLRAELATLSDAPSDLWGEEVPAGPTMRFGEAGPRIAAMRARLVALGDLAPTETAVSTETATPTETAALRGVVVGEAASVDPALFDETLEIAVRGFQRRHGLNDDGVVGPRTLAAMNVGVADRRGQILVNLERLRWLNRDLGQRHIYVNQADFTVRLVDRGEVLFAERVVVGKARKHRTPEFSDQMNHLVLNPTWYVPRSIATEEILPKLQEDPTYLYSKNMRLTSGGEPGPDATSVDWSVYSAADFPFRVQQRPGAGNALGRVKFMFPNQFSIYLHDTPSKRLFAKDARAFSHGCVRVQDPMSLARVLLAPQQDDPGAFIDRVLNRGKERRVNLDEPVPVHLTYRTAWIDENGVRQYRDDVYGRDARVLSALKAEGVAASLDG